jgi:hypothetical protein
MTISNKFVLVGALEGATVDLGGHDFVDGVYEFIYVVDGRRVSPSQDDVKMKAVSLQRNYQAFPEGSLELADAQKRYADRDNSDEPQAPADDGSSSQLPHEAADEADRSERTISSRKTATATRDALLKLDARNDDHWTDAGQPAVAAVRHFAGVETISRADITHLAPNLTREEAARVAGVDLGAAPDADADADEA